MNEILSDSIAKLCTKIGLDLSYDLQMFLVDLHKEISNKIVDVPEKIKPYAQTAAILVCISVEMCRTLAIFDKEQSDLMFKSFCTMVENSLPAIREEFEEFMEKNEDNH